MSKLKGIEDSIYTNTMELEILNEQLASREKLARDVENGIQSRIEKAKKDYADEVWTDTMGNLYAHKKGEGRRVMVCAHMDEVGMIIWGAMDNGLLAYQAGGIDPRVVVSKRVVIGPNDVPGVIGSKAIHLQSKEEFAHALGHEELFIDIGAESAARREEEEAEAVLEEAVEEILDI